MEGSSSSFISSSQGSSATAHYLQLQASLCVILFSKILPASLEIGSIFIHSTSDGAAVMCPSFVQGTKFVLEVSEFCDSFPCDAIQALALSF